MKDWERKEKEREGQKQRRKYIDQRHRKRVKEIEKKEGDKERNREIGGIEKE